MSVKPAQLKKISMGLLFKNKPSIFSAGFVYLLLCLVLTELSGRILGINMSLSELEQYYEHVNNGNLEYALTLASEMSPGLGAYIIDLLLTLVQHIVFAGFIIFILTTLRGMGATFGCLLDGFGLTGKLIWLKFLQGLFIGLWGLLFIVPGIIASYRYSMAMYILLDHPEMSAMECLRESKRMMHGHKAEAFMIDLSFFGWALLSIVPIIEYAVMLFYVPHRNTTITLFYEYLRSLNGTSEQYI